MNIPRNTNVTVVSPLGLSRLEFSELNYCNLSMKMVNSFV